MKKLLIAIGLVILIILPGCGKKVEDRPAAKNPAPFSKGPSGPPVISVPNSPQPK